MMVSSHQNCMRNKGPRAQGGGTGGLVQRLAWLSAGQRLSVLSSAPVTQGAFSLMLALNTWRLLMLFCLLVCFFENFYN